MSQRCSHYRESHWPTQGNRTCRETMEETQTDRYTETYSKDNWGDHHLFIYLERLGGISVDTGSVATSNLSYMAKKADTLTRLTSGGDRAGHLLIFILLGWRCQTSSKSSAEIGQREPCNLAIFQDVHPEDFPSLFIVQRGFETLPQCLEVWSLGSWWALQKYCEAFTREDW